MLAAFRWSKERPNVNCVQICANTGKGEFLFLAGRNSSVRHGGMKVEEKATASLGEPGSRMLL